MDLLTALFGGHSLDVAYLENFLNQNNIDISDILEQGYFQDEKLGELSINPFLSAGIDVFYRRLECELLQDYTEVLEGKEEEFKEDLRDIFDRDTFINCIDTHFITRDDFDNNIYQSIEDLKIKYGIIPTIKIAIFKEKKDEDKTINYTALFFGSDFINPITDQMTCYCTYGQHSEGSKDYFKSIEFIEDINKDSIQYLINELKSIYFSIEIITDPEELGSLLN